MTDPRRYRDGRDADDDRFPGRNQRGRRDERGTDRRRAATEQGPRDRSWRQEMVERPGTFMPDYEPDYDETYGGRAYGFGAGGRGTEGYNEGRRNRSDGERVERSLWDRGVDEVSSWLGDEDAERRRQIDQFRGKGPKNYKRSDDRIREDVCDRLTENGRVDASDIEVQVAQGEVTLQGTVASREQRRAAEDCAERASGIHHVQNNLRVRQPAQTDAQRQSQAECADRTGGIDIAPGPMSPTQTGKTDL